MKKCKITVMANTFNGDLAKEFANPQLGPCDLYEVGKEFYSNGWQKPEGLCDNAWKSMAEYVMTLSHGGKNFYNGWLKDENAAMIACNDGFRPVIFKVEATDIEADIFEGDLVKK